MRLVSACASARAAQSAIWPRDERRTTLALVHPESLSALNVPAMTLETPPPIATQAFTDVAAAVDRLERIYQRNTKFLRDRFEAYCHGGTIPGRVRAFYPFVRITTS